MDHNFPSMKNEVLLHAIKGKPTPYTPVWIMRQAGRYLPEFREVRKEHDFFEICRTPELACKMTLQPIKRFPLDAAIIFSDILVVPQAMGMEVRMEPGVGPVFPNPLKTPFDIKLLKPVDVKSELGYVLDALTLTRHKLEGKVPLIGFSGAPWTLMGYMIEGGGSKTMSKAKKWLYQYPEESHQLLKLIANVIIEYFVHQVKAGAQLLQIFDTSAEYLGPLMFQKFALPYLETISKEVKNQLTSSSFECVPMIVFAKGAHHSIDKLAKAGYDCVSIDWTIPPKLARNLVGPNITLQGNFDPCSLYAPKDVIRKLAEDMVTEFGTQRYICNLGHGIYPDMDPESVATFIDAVHSVSKKLIENN